jgi:hypothetical protein
VQLPVGELAGDPVRPVQGQGGLADAGRPGDRADHHRPGHLSARLLKDPGQSEQFVGPPDEVPHPHGQLVGHGLRRPGRAVAPASPAAPYRPGLRCVQVRVGGEDLLVDLAELGPWLGAKFVYKHPPGLPVGGQRLGPPAAPVKGQHELGVKAFPQRITRGEGLQAGD